MKKNEQELSPNTSHNIFFYKSTHKPYLFRKSFACHYYS